MERPPADVRKARMIKGLCTDCGEREHSAGRPRCDDCHDVYVSQFVHEPQLERRQRGRRRR